jgi:hypothetical protein
MQEREAKTQDGGPPTPSFVLESWGKYTWSKIMGPEAEMTDREESPSQITT